MAVAMNVEDSITKTLGRRESAVYMLYVRILQETLKHISSIFQKGLWDKKHNGVWSVVSPMC